MKTLCIRQRKILSLSVLKGFDLSIIEIGVPVTADEAEKVGLKNPGEVVIPSGDMGVLCKKNAYGYSYIDGTKQKEYRYVSTNWIHPYGNKDTDRIPVDISRKCYPKVEVPPYEIELTLYADEHGKQFVMAIITKDIRGEFLREAINLLLEIYGICYVFEGEIGYVTYPQKVRCNWEILPPGELPSKHVERQLKDNGRSTDTFDIFRLKYIEEYNFEKVVEGVNGFDGYYAYLFKDVCVFESAYYGNATYIVQRVGWEILSQKTKRELFEENKVMKKIIHSEKWRQSISEAFDEYGIAHA